ncbi:hypothetical protein Gasu2_61190 [Galdieria sulphuraria]|uniref:Uncharacterized protein n=1 Tax=Galdieria sulphuraria TaxID=130081 RepID=M2Y2B6_GALSU|nr:uncharacterized protein Gasu_27380 [Galdieria sulphuraria]EME29954.1 hypothetical protein Gasu_27380 [Galdieria sulphuraria]GJD12005.1 hypothetical protein Gasu2_61190 [Galdieria sulphuraria]|eukprot:XP_005706474.1 hypothetical protein Gasu_27380 [Galdieria sulphuraria]
MEQSLSICASHVTSRRLEIRERLDALNTLFIISQSNSRVPSSWQDFVFRGCLDCLQQVLKQQQSSLETEKNHLWKILEHLCQSNPPCIPELAVLPDLIEPEFGKHLSEERLKSIENILCSVIMERLALDTLTRLITVLSQKMFSSADWLRDCWRDVFCICLANLLKIIVRHLKGKNATKSSLDNHSKTLLLSLLAWKIPCCKLDSCPSYKLRRETVRRLVFYTFSLQSCYVVRDNSYRYDALEWIAKQSQIEMLSNSLRRLVDDCLDMPNSCFVQNVEEDPSNHKRRRLTMVEKDDRSELLMQMGTLLVDRYLQDTDSNNSENWMHVFVTFLKLVENNSIVLDSIVETVRQKEWKEALAVMSNFLESYLSSHFIAWQGMLSLSNISFSVMMPKTDKVITSIPQLEESQLWNRNNCVFLQLICLLLTKYSERRQLNIFLDKLCTNIGNERLYLTFVSSFQSSLISCMMKTTPKEFSDTFHSILHHFVLLYDESQLAEENERRWKRERLVFYFQLIFLLLKSLLQKLSHQEPSTLYWDCLNKTFDRWIFPYLLKDEKHNWLSDVECCLLISPWMTCECYLFLLYPSSRVNFDYLEQVLVKLEELASNHSFDQCSFKSLSTCAYRLELLTHFLSTRNKYLQGTTSRRRRLFKTKHLERLVIKRWIIPCTNAIREYLCAMKWNDYLVSFQVFEHLWMSLQHIASYLVLIPSKKYEKKYFSIWTKLFFPLLLVASSHCYLFEENRIPKWILDSWSILVDRLLDWSTMEALWERRHCRKKLLKYWKCMIGQLCFRAGLVTVEESTRRDLCLRPFTESLSTIDSSTLLHYLWDHGMVSMVLRFPWMLSKSFLEWIAQHYVSSCILERNPTIDTAWKVKVEKFLCDVYLCCHIQRYSHFLNLILMEPDVLFAVIPFVSSQVQIVSKGWLRFLKWLSKWHSNRCNKLPKWLSEMMERQCNSSHISSYANGLFYLVITFWYHFSQPYVRKLLGETVFLWIRHLWVATEDRKLRIEALCHVLEYGKRKKHSLLDVLGERLDQGFEILRQDIRNVATLSLYNSNQARRFLSDYFLWKKEAILSHVDNEWNSLIQWLLEPLGDTTLAEQEDILQLKQLCSIFFWRKVLESFWLQLVRSAVSHPTECLIACRLGYLLLLSANSDREKERTIILEIYRLLFTTSITEEEKSSNISHFVGASAMDCLAFIASKAHYSNFVEEYEDAMRNLFLVQRWYLERSLFPFLPDGGFVPWEQVCKIFSRSVKRLRKSDRYPICFVCNHSLMLMDLLLKEAEPFPYVVWIRRLWEPLLGWLRKGLSKTWLTWFLFQVIDLVEQQKPSLLHQPLFIIELCKLLQCKPEVTLANGNVLTPKESVMENVRLLLQRYSERYQYKGKA